MNQELKTKWLAALRSGEFEQTTGKLKHGDAFCCLGVLCVSAGATWKEHDEDNGDGGIDHYDHVPTIGDKLLSSGEDEELNGRFMKEIDMPVEAQKILVQMNDGDEKEGIASKPFVEIADYIEKNL